MEKRAVVLGILSKKKKKKVPIKKRLFFKNVLEYLRADSYMYSLLTSPATSLGSNHNSSLTREVDYMKENEKKLTEKVREYLKSDTYMYAPLCDSQQHVTYHKAYTSNVKRVDMEISTKKLIAKDNQSTMESSNVTVEDRLRESHVSLASIEFRKPRKCVKHKMYHNCRSSSVSEKGICDSQQRKLLVD